MRVDPGDKRSKTQVYYRQVQGVINGTVHK